MKQHFPIADLEQIDRGIYAGIVGWFNHLNEGEMVVGIRSALIEGKQACLYAALALSKAPIPDKEMREIEMKLVLCSTYCPAHDI